MGDIYGISWDCYGSYSNGIEWFIVKLLMGKFCMWIYYITSNMIFGFVQTLCYITNKSNVTRNMMTTIGLLGYPFFGQTPKVRQGDIE